MNKHDLYKQAYNDAFDWVRKTRIDIQQCSDSHGEKDQTEEKESKMTEIAATMPEGEFPSAEMTSMLKIKCV